MGCRSMGQKHSRRQQRAYTRAMSASRGASGHTTGASYDYNVDANTGNDFTINVDPKLKISGDEKDPPMGTQEALVMSKGVYAQPLAA